jgi:hypothetical protein
MGIEPWPNAMPVITTNNVAAKAIRMSRFPIAVLAIMLPSFAFAQSPQSYQPTTAVLLRQALECESIATNQYTQSQAKIADLTKQIDEMTKNVAELTKELQAAAKPVEPPK